PSMLLVQVSAAPVSEPCSGSLPEPVNVTPWPCVKVLGLAGAVIEAVGGWFGGTIVTVIEAEPVAPCVSCDVSVIVCVPAESVDVETLVPVPIAPLMLLLHVRAAPVSVPSSASLPLPVNVTVVPCGKLLPLAGPLMAAVGAWLAGPLPPDEFGAIDALAVAVLVRPPASVTVRETGTTRA